MKDVEGLVARIVASGRGRAVAIRETSALAPDPAEVLGIATIRVVTEDQVQALAYGSLDRRPATIARLHPLGRDTSDLEPFAEWLVDRIQRQIGAGRQLRVWVPHGKTIETLEILGRRYERNQHASPMLQEAARYCRIIAEETRLDSNCRRHGVSFRTPSRSSSLVSTPTFRSCRRLLARRGNSGSPSPGSAARSTARST